VTVVAALSDVVSSSPWTYALVLALVAGDSLLPAVPGETVVIAAAVLAGSGDLHVEIVVVAAMVGGFVGDNASYAVGRTAGQRAAARLTRGGHAGDLLEWAQRQMETRGRIVIVAARFIPAGRTATTLTAGIVAMPWRRFAVADAVAVTLWSAWMSALGYVGGATFRDQTWLALLLSLAAAAMVATAAELARRA
jgi:membrane-associated protein